MSWRILTNTQSLSQKSCEHSSRARFATLRNWNGGFAAPLLAMEPLVSLAAHPPIARRIKQHAASLFVTSGEAAAADAQSHILGGYCNDMDEQSSIDCWSMYCISGCHSHHMSVSGSIWSLKSGSWNDWSGEVGSPWSASKIAG